MKVRKINNVKRGVKLVKELGEKLIMATQTKVMVTRSKVEADVTAGKEVDKDEGWEIDGPPWYEKLQCGTTFWYQRLTKEVEEVVG